MRLGALAAVLSLATVALAGGSVALWAEACSPTKLPAAEAQAELLGYAGLDLTLLAIPDVPTDQPVDTHACTGEVRPGARMTSPVGCTMSWIFRDTAGSLYQSTAGHCTGAGVGQSVSVLGVGFIGRVVYRVAAGVGNDFGLVKLDPSVHSRVNPTLCHWGGPNGIATPADDETAGLPHDVMLHYGWGVMWQDQETRGRAGYIPRTGWSGDGSVRMRGFTDGGDSGSPMMLKSGKAAGVHTHRLDAAAVLGFGVKAASRLDVHVPRAEAALGVDLDIVPGLAVDLTGLTVPESFAPALQAPP